MSKADEIRSLLFQKLEKDFMDDKKQNLSIQQYILEIEDFLVNN